MHVRACLGQRRVPECRKRTRRCKEKLVGGASLEHSAATTVPACPRTVAATTLLPRGRGQWSPE
eukprot:99838-Pyramimonas_sp.AAC.1